MPKKHDKMRTITFRAPAKLLADATTVAAEDGRTLSSHLRQLMRVSVAMRAATKSPAMAALARAADSDPPDLYNKDTAAARRAIGQVAAQNRIIREPRRVVGGQAVPTKRAPMRTKAARKGARRG